MHRNILRLATLLLIAPVAFLALQSNVAADMQLEATKRPRYLMVCAQLRSARRLGPATGTGIVYVVEANSGKFAAYGVPWRHDLFVSGRPQQGELLLLQVGSARTAPVRD